MPRHHQRDHSASGPSQRQLRVGELIRHALAEMLSRGDIHDPTIEAHMITVPEVRMAADLRLATIYVMPLGGKDAKEVVAALERNKKRKKIFRSIITFSDAIGAVVIRSSGFWFIIKLLPWLPGWARALGQLNTTASPIPDSFFSFLNRENFHFDRC